MDFIIQRVLILFTIILQINNAEGNNTSTVSWISSSTQSYISTHSTVQTGIKSSSTGNQVASQLSGSVTSPVSGYHSSIPTSSSLSQIPSTSSLVPTLSSTVSSSLSATSSSQSSISTQVSTSSVMPSSSRTASPLVSSQSSISALVSTSSVMPSSSRTASSLFSSQSSNSVQVSTSSVMPSSSRTASSLFSSQSSISALVSTSSVMPTHSSISTPASSLSDKSSSIEVSQSSATFTGAGSSLSSTFLTALPKTTSVSSSHPIGSAAVSTFISSSVYTVTSSPATTQPGSNKFTFSFKITNKVCSLGIRENNVINSDYQNLAKTILDAVNNAFRGDPNYRGSKILSFDCGSVIPFVEVSKNASASNDAAIELKPISDMVNSGSVGSLSVESGSFVINPAKSVPNLYIILDTKLSNRQFCDHKANFKNRFAAIMVTKDGLSFIAPSQIVIFSSNCNDQSTLYSAAKVSFYITESPSVVVTPDPELTIRAYKLIKQFIEDGTTWRLSASFDDKVESVELAGKDKVEDTAYSELTIVLIGMGTTLALLMLIIIIILVLIHLRKKTPKELAVTYQNRSSETGNNEVEYASINEGYEKTEITIGGHDYQYPTGPDNDTKSKPSSVQNGYQELHVTTNANSTSPVAQYQPLKAEEEQRTTVVIEPEMTANASNASPVGQYQPLTAEEELRTTVVVEPEESAGYIVSMTASTPEARDLTADELAQRKDVENQLKREFESLENDMPSSNVYSSSLMAKNRLSTVIPKPETRIVLRMQSENPDSDYINANIVMDTHHNKKYIITQGPLQKTTDDFWRMIVEQNVNVIVMLTPLVQEGMEKCYQYWPPDSVPRKYGDIEVHLSKKELKPDFTVTTMEIESKNGQHEAVLFRYMTWPENGIPENSRSFVSFLLEAKKANEGRGNSPMVVLCSNGIGMSGVFAAVANGIESFNDKRAVDVYSIAKGVRRDRAGAIQHFEQYKFIYQALYEYTLKFQDDKDPFANQANVTSAF